MKPPLNAARSSSWSASGITAGRSSFSPSGLSAAGSRLPATILSVVRRRSIATTNTSAQPRSGSGWSSVFIMYGCSFGRRGSVIGTQSPSPLADQDLRAAPGSFGRKGGSAGGPAEPLATGAGGGGGGSGAADQ